MEKLTPVPDAKQRSDLPFSPAAERNKNAILEKLKTLLEGSELVLEIGSGTAQHAIHIASALPNLVWQLSDLPQRIKVTDAVAATANRSNIKRCIALDASKKSWPSVECNVIYTANTTHIMSWEAAQNMVAVAGDILPSGGLLIIYGPFKYDGDFTSESNQMFDVSLKKTDRKQGIRDFEGVERVAVKHGLVLQDDFSMPANNRLLVYKKI